MHLGLWMNLARRECSGRDKKLLCPYFNRIDIARFLKIRPLKCQNMPFARFYRTTNCLGSKICQSLELSPQFIDINTGRPFSLDLPRYLPPIVQDKMLDDIAKNDIAIIDNLMGKPRALALLAELNAIFEHESPLMKKSTSSIYVNGRMIEYEKYNVFSISDFSGLDSLNYDEKNRRNLNLENLSKSPIPLTLDFEQWLRNMLLDVFDGHCVKNDAVDDSELLDSTSTRLKLVNAHPKIAVSVPSSSKSLVSASYPPHFDDPLSSDGNRKVSATYYLNPHWKPGCGGELRCYCIHREGRFDPRVLDVEPVLDRLVVFRSDILMHSVCPWTPLEPTAEAAQEDAEAIRTLPLSVDRASSVECSEPAIRGPRSQRRWCFVEWAYEAEPRVLADAKSAQEAAKRTFSKEIRTCATDTLRALAATDPDKVSWLLQTRK